MIHSELGIVKITRPDIISKELFKCSETVATAFCEAIIGADLTAIFNALASMYGIDHAMEIWTRSVEVYIESMKGETK